MVRTLGDFVEQRMRDLGLNQTELARRCGVPRLTINRLVTGKTALPDADTRRKLAKGMGVSHVDIFVAAGELEPSEVTAAGVVGVVEEDAGSPRASLHQAINQYDWDEDKADEVADFIEFVMTPRPARRR